MTFSQRLAILSLRLTLGWMFFYAGITKVLDPTWSAGGFLRGAKTFTGFYTWLTSPNILPVVDFLNEWGLTLLGISLLLGLLVRVSSSLGILLMILYYLPRLQFPYPNDHAFLVDEHLIYIAALLVLSTLRAGRIWGLETWCSNLPICKRFPTVRKMLG